MNGETFLRMFGEIDEEYIQQANEDINDWEQSNEGVVVYAGNSRKTTRRTVIASAAVAAVAVFGVVMLILNIGRLRTQEPVTGEQTKDCIISLAETWYEDGMFYEDINSAGESVLCYYSKTDDRSAVVCGNPECTHISKTSPNCSALRGGALERYGFNRIGDKLYYFAVKTLSDKSVGSIDLIVSDIDGKNRQIIASIEDTVLPFTTDVRYIDDHVLVSYYVIYEFVEDEGTGELEMVAMEKYKFFMQWIDLSTGEIETLVSREGYSGIGRGTVYDNKVYYHYYHTEPPTGEALTPETAPEWHGGLYIRDLATGEEKQYENMSLMSLDYFSPKGIICYDHEKLYLFDPENETFSFISDYELNKFTFDGKDAIFSENSDAEYWTRYNFETGERTQIPRYNGEPELYLNSVHTVGDTVWIDFVINTFQSGYLQHAYTDREDFYEGRFENIKPIKGRFEQ